MKREYVGPPIDGRYQYITERPNMTAAPPHDNDDDNGETVAGTSPDDFFNESTDNIPTHLNTDDIPEDELQAIGWALSVSISHAAIKMEQFTPEDIKQIIDRHLNEDDIARIKDYDKVPGVPMDELTETQQAAVEAFRSHPDFPDVSPRDVADGEEFDNKTVERAAHRAFPSIRSFDDLKPSQKVSVLIWAYEGLDKKPAEVKKKYPTPNDRAIGDARRIYPDLIEEKQPVPKEELQEALDEYNSDHSKPRTGQSSDEDTDTDSTEPIEDKQYPDDFTECQQWFIEAIARNPGSSPDELAEKSRWTATNYYNVVNDHPELVKERIEDVGVANTTDDVFHSVLKKTDHLGKWNFSQEAETEPTDHEPPAEPPKQPEPPTTPPEYPEPTERRLPSDIVRRPANPRSAIHLRGDIADRAREYLAETEDYVSLDDLAAAAIQKEINGWFESGESSGSQSPQQDTIEAVIELADVEPSKASAIRTLISDE